MPNKNLMLRTIYRWVAFLALPGGLWGGYEMYGLTLSGPQMLFYSVSHTMPLIVLALLVSIPMGLVWMIQSVIAILNSRYAQQLAVPTSAHITFVVGITVYGISLWSYDDWANSMARPVVCVLGIMTVCLVSSQAWLHLRQRVALGSH